jgi:hypothetical protein
MAQGRAAEACPLFEQSQRLEAGIGTQYNLASCYEAIGRFASAYRLFFEVSATAEGRGQSERARAAAARAQSVEPRLSRLVIEIESAQLAALTVERDGEIVAAAEWGRALPVDPGSHLVRASGPGLLAWAQVIDVGTSPQTYTLRIPALPLAVRAPADCDAVTGQGCAEPAAPSVGSASFLASTRHQIGFVALGVGLAGLGVGTGLALHASSKNASSEAAGCDARGCPTPASLQLRRQALSAGDWATLSAGVGLAGVAAAGILFWALPEPGGTTSSAAQLWPRVTAESAGVDVYGRF